MRFGGIGSQRIGKLCRDGNETALVELGVAYGEDRIREVDIVERQALCFAEAQTRAIEQQEQCPQGVAVELDRTLPAGIDRVEQTLQLVMRVAPNVA